MNCFTFINKKGYIASVFYRDGAIETREQAKFHAELAAMSCTDVFATVRVEALNGARSYTFSKKELN